MTTEHFGIRVKRLLTANVHALIGSLENRMPQAILEQYLREFDDVIGQARVALGRHEAARHQAAKAIARINNEIERLNDLLGTALARNDDAAVRAGAERQIELEDQLGVLQQSLHEASERAQVAEAELLGLRAKRAEMEAGLRELIATRAAAPGGAEPRTESAAGADPKAERIEQGFNRTMAGATGVTGLGTSPSSADPSLLNRLETLHREQRIEERVARLKAQPGQSAADLN
ncbi:PspA/IM30 family protein [Burkholderia pseudomultivorans]|uniref:PspA/IM30 family protein n=1 Tax=Burkholderia pseudomultivorans TaxID=1207504 RepID=UPI00188FE2FE|nr:PspA/IM30 family protein [Burkholderia pseudomultivorans]MBF5011478.1 PspA/IM30 family protein [Burkholderia pseudomultivorans]